MQTMPASMGLCLELAYPITTTSSTTSSRSEEPKRDYSDSAPFRHRLPLNAFIDSILRTVYHASTTTTTAAAAAPTSPDGAHGVRRQIVFTSSSPDACAAVNWKQPNCQYHRPFFFSPFSFLSFFFFFFFPLF